MVDKELFKCAWKEHIDQLNYLAEYLPSAEALEFLARTKELYGYIDKAVEFVCHG